MPECEGEDALDPVWFYRKREQRLYHWIVLSFAEFDAAHGNGSHPRTVRVRDGGLAYASGSWIHAICA